MANETKNGRGSHVKGETAPAKPAKRAAAAKEPGGAKKKKPNSDGFWKGVQVFLIALMVLIILTGGAAVWMGYRITKSDTILPNVYVEGVNLGGLTREQALKKLNDGGWDERAAIPMTVKLPADVRFTLDRVEAGAAMTAETAAEAAFRYGHGSSWFDNLLRYGESYLTRVDVATNFLRQDTEYIRAKAQEGIAAFRAATAADPKAGPYTVDRENARLTLVKGAGELEINLDGLCNEISKALRADELEVDHVRIDNTLIMPDFDAIFQELNVEPADAYFAEENFEVVDEVVGCTFDVEGAKKLWEKAEPMEEVAIPLVITEPEVTAEELRDMLFRDKLGEQTTYYASSSENRINNISLAASIINGVVLMPGEEFSYNGTVGQRTKDAGFLEAGAYMDGEVVQEVGGGICQVSSTLYCAVMYANLETVSRTSHYFRVDYLPIAYDATVSWPKPDYKFRNNRDYPVKIVASTDVGARSLTIEIWGTDVDGSYVVLKNSSALVYDSTYTDVVVGWGAQAWREVYDADGNLIRTIKEPYSSYNKHPEDIDWPPEKLAADRNEIVPVEGSDGGSGYSEPANVWLDDYGAVPDYGESNAEITFG